MKWEYEKSLWEQGFTAICGVDEVGRGPLAGPVVTAAVLVPEDAGIRAELAAVVRDSKCLRAAQREEIYAFISDACLYSVGRAEVADIDTLNIRGATLLAMRRAVNLLEEKAVIDAVLVDGRDRIPGVEKPQKALIKGDAYELAVACASIIAKVTRDRYMAELAKEYPWYGWERNAGYGTMQHLAGLCEHGVTPQHRRSFAPVAAVLARAGEQEIEVAA